MKPVIALIITFIVCLCIMLSGCGTFSLGSVDQPDGKSLTDLQSDQTYCIQQAQIADSAAADQIKDYIAGLTIIGIPFANASDKEKQRQVYTDCMTARGYTVTVGKD